MLCFSKEFLKNNSVIECSRNDVESHWSKGTQQVFKITAAISRRKRKAVSGLGQQQDVRVR